ncbi:MAG: excinuclease ABC subunit UvrC [bacterium]|nr:excinuclease ABC subunit UvrC [bacterium]
MRDERHRVIYVGKSSCLKNRVRSYFHSHTLADRTRWMVSLVCNFDIITVNTEMEALILENILIKKYRPYFNILFRDDKSYPYLELTTFEEFPRLRIVRTNGRKKSTYFGPYAIEGLALRRTKRLVQKLFKLRPCHEKLDKPRSRPCLYYHIKQCTAPCCRLVSPQEYAQQVEMAKKCLSGHTGHLSRKLSAQIHKEAARLNYERCAQLRDLIKGLELITQKQEIIFTNNLDEDYVSLTYDKSGFLCCALLWQVREGRLQGQQSFILESQLGSDLPTDLGSFLQQYYSQNGQPPTLIVVETLPSDAPLLEEWLSSLAGHKVKLTVPQRGEKKKLLAKTQENARRCLDDELHSPSMHQTRQEAVKELKEALQLEHLPLRMECYDISNIQGKYAVGSMVVFEHGLPHRSHYRKFKIQGLDTPNDFAMMRQVLRRRLSHISGSLIPQACDTKVKRDPSLETAPELIIVDGGLGQLGVAIEVIKEAGLEHSIALAGLAKREEELFRPGSSESILLPLNSPAYNMVTHLRNEAHRFAITFHRSLRGKGMFNSTLAEIPGLGEKYIKLLRTHFTDLASLKRATAQELERLPGLGPKMAAKIVNYLHELDPSEPTDS